MAELNRELFYVHGMGGSAADWHQVRAHMPGTPLSLDPFAESPVACAKTLARQLEAAKAPIAITGYSMGGRISLLAAEQLAASGRMPSALILVSAGLGIASEAERAKRRQQDEEWAALAHRDPALFWDRWYEQEIFASLQALHPEIKLLWEEARISMNIEALSSQLRHLGPGCHEDLRPVLSGLLRKGLRVLYIVGELDKKYLDLSKSVLEIGKATVVTVPGAGHVLPLEAPKVLAGEIRKFLE